MFRKLTALLLCLSMAAAMGSVFAETADQPAAAANRTITEKTMATYIKSDQIKMDMPYCFIEGYDGIPWVELGTWTEIASALMGPISGDPAISLTSQSEGEQFALIRENGAAMLLDFEKDTVTFNNYNVFISSSYAVSMMDILATKSFDSEGRPYLFKRLEEMSFDRPGALKVFDLGTYGIELIHQDGKYYMPLNTLFDICLTPKINFAVLYNGDAVFIVSDGGIGSSPLRGDITISALGDIYYSAEPRERTEAEARFGYAELCMFLDNFYGLKKIHQITDFNTIFEEIGIKDELMSPDAGLADIALKAFISLYIDDLHSRFLLPSWMVPKDADHEVLRIARSMKKTLNDEDVYGEARKAGMPDGVPNYQEIGNTAFITFDVFQMDILSSDVYSLTDEQIEEAALRENPDTIALIIYANRQIRRENSPIENVVIDLSNNPGGAIDAAAFVIAWYLGEADLAFQDQNTGTMSASAYRADVNLDREFDEKDTVSDKNLYCLISPVSFSCGNLVPACFKASQQVTLIGRKSGGGSCSVQFASTAWGSFFKMSSQRNISTLKNGSMYDIDQGVDPDYYLSKLTSYYDREKLTETINGMN